LKNAEEKKMIESEKPLTNKNKRHLHLSHYIHNIKGLMGITKQPKCILALKESCKSKPFLKILEISEVMENIRNSGFKTIIGIRSTI